MTKHRAVRAVTHTFVRACQYCCKNAVADCQDCGVGVCEAHSTPAHLDERVCRCREACGTGAYTECGYCEACVEGRAHAVR